MLNICRMVVGIEFVHRLCLISAAVSCGIKPCPALASLCGEEGYGPLSFHTLEHFTLPLMLAMGDRMVGPADTSAFRGVWLETSGFHQAGFWTLWNKDAGWI